MADTESPKIKLYRLDELELKAEAILKGSDRFLKSFRFDIESFTISQLRLIPDIHYGLKSNHDTWAYMLKDCPRIFFDDQLINRDNLEKKYRFTIGEEIAHYHLHPKIFASCSSIEERNKIYFSLPNQLRKYIENNARALASALLMHKDIFEKRVSVLLRKINNNDTSNVDALLDSLATQLGHDFDVNFTAARSRLKMRGYHKRLEVNYF